MKKYFFVYLILISLFTTILKAEIAYIDINFILKSSDVRQFLNNHIKTKQAEYNQKYQTIEDELIDKEKTLIAQQNVLNKDEFENKLKILTNEVQEYRANKKKSFENLKQFKIDNTKEILKVLNPIITNYVNLNSISIVLPKKNIIVGKKNLDITDKIIVLLNDSIKKLNF